MKNGVLTKAKLRVDRPHGYEVPVWLNSEIPSCNELFSGDPVWATLEMGGLGPGRTFYMTTERPFLHTREHGTSRAKPDSSSQKTSETSKKYTSLISMKTEFRTSTKTMMLCVG